MAHNVLVDFSHLADLNGFGEIARNYAPLLADKARGRLSLLKKKDKREIKANLAA